MADIDKLKDEFKKAADTETGWGSHVQPTLFGLPIKFTEGIEGPQLVLKPLAAEGDIGTFHVSPEVVAKIAGSPESRDPDKVHEMKWVWRDDGSPSWWCGCGLLDYDGNRRDCLRDFLNAFSDGPTEFGSYHIDRKKMDEVRERWTPQAIDVIAYLLDEMGYLEHSGSVCSSQWLMPEGERLRTWTNDEKWEDD